MEWKRVMKKYRLLPILFAFAFIFIFSSCSEEDSAGNNVIDIEVISTGYIPRVTYKSEQIIVQDYGGYVYNETTDQEIYVETNYYETCIDWEVYITTIQRCRTWETASNAVYEIPLAIGENRIYMGLTRDAAATAEPSFIIDRVVLTPIEVVHNDNCENPYPIYGPTLLIGNASDHYICFLFEADISKVYTILTGLSGSLHYNIMDINYNDLVEGDTVPWTDDLYRSAEINLDAGQKIYIQIQSSLIFELGVL